MMTTRSTVALAAVLTLLAPAAWADGMKEAADHADSLPPDIEQPVSISVTGWLQATPSFTHHLLGSLTVPLVKMPLQAAIDAIPTVGTGSASVIYPWHWGQVAVIPGIGLRYTGALPGASDGFEYGPQGRVAIICSIISNLYVVGRFDYAPWLGALNRSGAGSYGDAWVALVANVGRISYSAGFMGLANNTASAGFGAFSGTLSGGPALGVAVRL